MAERTIDEILAKIAKLQALAGSCNPHEAALAAERVQDMLFRHHLALAQANGRGRGGVCEFQCDRVLLDGMQMWKQHLLAVIAHAHFCEAAFRDRSRAVHLVGRRGDLRVALALYDYLRMELDRLSRFEYANHLASSSRRMPRRQEWSKSFFAGAVSQVGERLERKRQSQLASTPEAGKLVRSLDAALDRAVKDFLGDLDTTTTRTKVCAVAYEAGEDAAARLSFGDDRLGHDTKLLMAAS